MFRERQEVYKIRQRLAKRGNRIEAVRGTVCFVPGSGTRRWTLKWEHEPAISGAGDGVGVCASSLERHGPSSPPLLGGDSSSSSIALFASGNCSHPCSLSMPCIKLASLNREADTRVGASRGREAVHRGKGHPDDDAGRWSASVACRILQASGCKVCW